MSEWAKNKDLSLVKGNIINAIIDQANSTTDNCSIVEIQAFVSEIARNGPVDHRTTHMSFNNGIIASDMEFDGVDILSSMREFVDMLEMSPTKKAACLEQLAEMYAQGDEI